MKALGWPAPKRFEHAIRDSSNNTVLQLVSYSAYTGASPTDCFLQLNLLHESDDVLLLAGAVYAIKYRICTGWHVIYLPRYDKLLNQIAGEWSSWLGLSNFSSLAARATFRNSHPETIGYTWKRIRQIGPPYFVVTACRAGHLRASQRKSETCNELFKGSRQAKMCMQEKK